MRGIIITETNFAMFCIMRRLISKDVCSVIIAGKRPILENITENVLTDSK